MWPLCAKWGRFRHTLTAMNLRFAGLFDPEGVQSRDFFLVTPRFAEIPGVLQVS
jgi:hypothetical protein